MKNRHTIFLASLSLILVLSSCITRKKLTYLQYSGMEENYGMQTRETKATVTPAAYKLMPYDNLYIRVITPDPQWSALFNSMPVGQSGGLTEESAGLLGYPVDVNGFIDIPYVGMIEVAGKTLAELKIELESTFKKYVSDAAITVRMVNNYVSVIGEVRVPGRFPLIKDRINVFEALSMAGDMTEYSNRRKVQLIRPSPYGPVVKTFSLNDRSILTSDLYFVMPNDIIYAQPLKGRSFQMNVPTYSMIFSTITTVLVILAFFLPGR